MINKLLFLTISFKNNFSFVSNASRNNRFRRNNNLQSHVYLLEVFNFLLIINLKKIFISNSQGTLFIHARTRSTIISHESKKSHFIEIISSDLSTHFVSLVYFAQTKKVFRIINIFSLLDVDVAL